MASIATSQKVNEQITRRVGDLLNNYWQLIPCGEARAIKKKIADVAAEIKYTPKQFELIALIQEDAEIWDTVTTSDNYSISVMSGDDRTIVEIGVKGRKIPSPNSYNAGKCIMRTNHPLYLEVIPYAHFNKCWMETLSFVRRYLLAFLEDRKTYGHVQRDWPELVNYMRSDVRAKLGNTVSRQKAPIDKTDRINIDICNTILAKCLMLEGNGVNNNDYKL